MGRMAGDFLGSCYGPMRNKQVIASGTGIDRVAGVMPDVMMYMVE